MFFTGDKKLLYGTYAYFSAYFISTFIIFALWFAIL